MCYQGQTNQFAVWPSQSQRQADVSELNMETCHPQNYPENVHAFLQKPTCHAYPCTNSILRHSSTTRRRSVISKWRPSKNCFGILIYALYHSYEEVTSLHGSYVAPGTMLSAFKQFPSRAGNIELFFLVLVTKINPTAVCGKHRLGMYQPTFCYWNKNPTGALSG